MPLKSVNVTEEAKNHLNLNAERKKGIKLGENRNVGSSFKKSRHCLYLCSHYQQSDFITEAAWCQEQSEKCSVSRLCAVFCSVLCFMISFLMLLLLAIVQAVGWHLCKLPFNS